jgi:PHD/YefM family antitoxin component YafN of YafNO toxin-antitoxin module
MATIVSSSEFRTRMGAMLALADRGEQVVIKRNRKPSYVLSSVEAENAEEAEDNFFTPEMVAEIKSSHAEYLTGSDDAITCSNHEELQRFLDSL